MKKALPLTLMALSLVLALAVTLIASSSVPRSGQSAVPSPNPLLVEEKRNHVDNPEEQSVQYGNVSSGILDLKLKASEERLKKQEENDIETLRILREHTGFDSPITNLDDAMNASRLALGLLRSCTLSEKDAACIRMTLSSAYYALQMNPELQPEFRIELEGELVRLGIPTQ